VRSSDEAPAKPRSAWLAVLFTPALALGLAMLCTAAPAAAADAAAPTEAEVVRSLKAVGADPNLATEETRRVPRFFEDEPKDEPKRRRVSWLKDLFSFIAQTSRVLLWVIGIILGAVLIAMLTRLMVNFRPGRGGTVLAAAPTHVRELDVRPESLPDQIGPAALALWEQGEQRAALALLYRGLVSRLIHVHAVPIRHSTTEAGCMELARKHVSAAAVAYVMQLVRCWQRSVYGGMLPEDASFRALCGSFDATLAPAASLDKRAA
jgi:hypothetical protein